MGVCSRLLYVFALNFRCDFLFPSRVRFVTFQVDIEHPWDVTLKTDKNNVHHQNRDLLQL